MLERIAEGRTDLVVDYVGQGNPPNAKTSDGGPLLQWCAYYGDVSAIKFLLAKGETLKSLGADLGLNAAAERRSTQKMCMAIRRFPGPVGICARIRC
jgi:uncharacterized protein